MGSPGQSISKGWTKKTRRDIDFHPGDALGKWLGEGGRQKPTSGVLTGGLATKECQEMNDTVPDVADERSHAVESVRCNQGKGELGDSGGGGKVTGAWSSGFGCSCSKVRYPPRNQQLWMQQFWFVLLNCELSEDCDFRGPLGDCYNRTQIQRKMK